MYPGPKAVLPRSLVLNNKNADVIQLMYSILKNSRALVKNLGKILLI